ncbi:cytochrome c oxidase subunit 3 family protein [Stutzerimonas nosocomialis]|uniref:cytochrome c oxidase subunit 3 n=1 Tax=Stutzerimonas nosocomialis TaxID=1056496 RepID=UPI001108E38A|nr:cytochrome c oxidase subunit 3 [Stutzerimonas nosocomialis]TLX56830.1 cytochrome c oxidase subunit 3 family protein [Stutzerimonas nosocomialis]
MSISAEPVAHRLPGDLAMWFFIFAELAVFGVLILAFAVTQWLQPALFRGGRQALDGSTGLALTASLLTSGWLAAMAVEQVRACRPQPAAGLLLAAFACAGVYVWLKLAEYAHLAGAGLGLEYDTFFTLYWILTGFHFLHVLLGIVILGWMALRCRQGAYLPDTRAGLESGVLYWHMVDLVWVLLFPLVYLLG